MLALGLVLLILGLIFGIYWLWIVGLVLACVGLALLLFGAVGHRTVGGHRYWF